MCLAIPMMIVEARPDGSGVVEVEGSRREVDLSLLQDPKPGEYVIVHAGFAIEKLNQDDANERIAMFEELARSMEE
jgi:hydrogenase expression/formation protein HypC